MKMKSVSLHFIETPTWGSILLATVLLVWQVLWGFIPPSVEIAFFTFFVLLMGIPHGALDHLVGHETALRQNKPFSLGAFLFKYLSTMFVYALAWYIFPTVSLLFFLIISAWHFGETDIEAAPNTRLWNVTQFLFGTLVLAAILLTHSEETTPILSRITQDEFLSISVWQFCILHKVKLLTVATGLFAFTFILAQKQSPIVLNKPRLIQLSLILVLSYFLPLLPAFALYFGGWHSICSFKSISDYLRQNTNSNNYFTIWLKALFFSLVAFVFLGLIVCYWFYFQQVWNPLPLVFVFLSMITLPHLNVMHGMHSHK